MRNVKRFFDIHRKESPDGRCEHLRRIRQLETNRMSARQYRETAVADKKLKQKQDNMIKMRDRQRKARADRLGISVEEYIEQYGRPEQYRKEPHAQLVRWRRRRKTWLRINGITTPPTSLKEQNITEDILKNSPLKNERKLGENKSPDAVIIIEKRERRSWA